MSWTLERRIARAEELETRFPDSTGVLRFYGEIARFQKRIADALSVRPESDPEALAAWHPELGRLVRQHGPAELASHAPPDSADLLTEMWSGNPPGDEQMKFFARVLLQPFAEALAVRGNPDTQSASPLCPFCSAHPVCGILRGEGGGAKRNLLCSLCATEWQYRRVICPNCGEENRDQLPIYLAGNIDYVRVDACDTCRSYIKTVDLTKDGHAVPVVDELATLSLTLWAEEKGYAKVETNLLGM